MTIKYLIIHHSAVSRTKNSAQFDAINAYHKRKGWGMIGYNYLIESDGSLREGRKHNVPGAHCLFCNYISLGICLTGNFDIEMPTKKQEETLKSLLLTLTKQYPNAKIKYHRDFAVKSCPGRLILDDWAKNLIINTMNYVIDKKKDQYLRDEVLKIAISISDPKELKLLVDKGLSGPPKKVNDMSKYLIYRGMFENSWKDILNL